MRRVSVAERTVKTVSSVALVAFLAASVWAGANATSVVVTADQLADAQQMILTLHDTVHVLRTQVLYDAARIDSAPDMIMPVAGQVTSQFSRSRFHPLLQLFRPHHGVAPAVATVTFVGWKMGDGLTVELSHRGGVTTLYGHCRDVLVRVGQRVHAGQAIATVGSSGLATGPHVHFEVMMHGTPIDPLRYLSASHDSTTAVAEKLRREDNQPASHAPTVAP
jgi:murein DD-endopeptidase MepM/ murein hydrolase activator NlpD